MWTLNEHIDPSRITHIRYHGRRNSLTLAIRHDDGLTIFGVTIDSARLIVGMVVFATGNHFLVERPYQNGIQTWVRKDRAWWRNTPPPPASETA